MLGRRTRAVVVGMGAGALALGMAAPALAADAFTNDTLPGKTVLTAGGAATTVTLTTPEGFDCTKWTVRKVGQKRATVNVTAPTLLGCTNATALPFTVSVPAEYTKRATVVVKFIVTNADGTAKAVESLVVKVNPTGAPQTGQSADKPGKGPKQ